MFTRALSVAVLTTLKRHDWLNEIPQLGKGAFARAAQLHPTLRPTGVQSRISQTVRGPCVLDMRRAPARGGIDAASSSMAVPRSRGLRLEIAVIGLVLAAGCNGRGDAREEARTLMTSLNAVSDEGSLTQRNAALQRLRQLQLHVPAHARTRELCAAAHKGLLDAEVAQAEARRALASAGQNQPAQHIAPNQAQLIAADIERSNRALATAKQRFPECERAMRDLLKEVH